MWTCSTALHMETLKGSFEHAAKTKEAGSSPLLFSLHRETHRPGRFFVTAVPARVIEWCWEMKFFFPQMVILVEWAAKLCCYSFSPFLFFLSSCLLPCVCRFLPVCSWGQMSSSGSFLYSFTPGFWRKDWLWNPELTISISDPWRTTTHYASQCWGGGCALPYLTWTWVASFLV